MRTCNARKRALLTLCLALLALLPLGVQAAADDPTPRAVPIGRGNPGSFASYAALEQYAFAVAAQQSAIDAQLAAVRAQSASAHSALDALMPWTRGGLLFDPDPPHVTGSDVARLKRDIAALDQRYAQIVASGALTAPATPWRMPTDGEITQPFGPTDVWLEPSETYQGVAYAHFHEGVDIAGAWAAPVYAPERGRVVFVGQMSDGAEIVVLAHDDGYVSMYAHLDNNASPPPVAAGDVVAAGQQIGTVGLTGMTTGEHLHWQVWHDGTLVDPLSLVGQ